jgi:hypothetical protein
MVRDLSATTGDETGQAKALPRGSRINRALIVVEICILLGILVLFNAFPEKVGIYSSAVEPYLFVPLLTPEWLSYVPWLNVWWGLALMLAAIKLVYGRWTRALRWADLGVNLLGICIVAAAFLWYAPGDGAPLAAQRTAGVSLVGFKACLGLALAALVAGLFGKLAMLGISVHVVQVRFGGLGR